MLFVLLVLNLVVVVVILVFLGKLSSCFRSCPSPSFSLIVCSCACFGSTFSSHFFVVIVLVVVFS